MDVLDGLRLQAQRQPRLADFYERVIEVIETQDKALREVRWVCAVASRNFDKDALEAIDGIAREALGDE